MVCPTTMDRDYRCPVLSICRLADCRERAYILSGNNALDVNCLDCGRGLLDLDDKANRGALPRL